MLDLYHSYFYLNIFCKMKLKTDGGEKSATLASFFLSFFLSFFREWTVDFTNTFIQKH